MDLGNGRQTVLLKRRIPGTPFNVGEVVGFSSEQAAELLRPRPEGGPFAEDYPEAPDPRMPLDPFQFGAAIIEEERRGRRIAAPSVDMHTEIQQAMAPLRAMIAALEAKIVVASGNQGLD